MLMNVALILLFSPCNKIIFTKRTQFIHSTIYENLGCSLFFLLWALYEKHPYAWLLVKVGLFLLGVLGAAEEWAMQILLEKANYAKCLESPMKEIVSQFYHLTFYFIFC